MVFIGDREYFMKLLVHINFLESFASETMSVEYSIEFLFVNDSVAIGINHHEYLFEVLFGVEFLFADKAGQKLREVEEAAVVGLNKLEQIIHLFGDDCICGESVAELLD
jgi:hypothetical protein